MPWSKEQREKYTVTWAKRSPEQRARAYQARKDQAAAKALAEGREPGRQGRPPVLSPEQKETSRKEQNRKRSIRARAKRKAARAAASVAKGRKPGVVGMPSKLTVEERKKRSVARALAAKAKNLAKYRALDAARQKEKRRLKKLGLWISPAKKLTAEQRKLNDRAHAHNRRARAKANGGKHTRQDIENLIVSQNGCCAMCRIPFGEDGFHVDHVIPLAAGGSNGRENIQLLHPVCNLKKGAMIAPDVTHLASC